ncbi:hypothetical protein ACIBO2_09370 [Nonomuraea sp. NPDC050022]|uniref:hypothetical protein n=1 Tax=Nonomuraea sp. NPDC050022 TaxID=3364358 RepID=UPI0037A5D974
MPKKINSIYVVTPGSLWADQRALDRTLLVEAIDGEHVICTTLTNSRDVQRALDLPVNDYFRGNPRDMRGTTSRIRLDRFRPIANGFTFVTATAAHLSAHRTTR